jgi:hypothetical protein
VDPLLIVNWFPELLRVRTSTGDADAPAAQPAPEPAPGAKPEAEQPSKDEAPVLTLRGLELPKDLRKPVFVYFHWPHEDGDRGKRIVKFCTGPMDDEAFIRVSFLFHCVEVNTRDSEQRLVGEAKVLSTPAILVCRPSDMAIVWRTEDAGLGGKALAAALKKVVQDRFPERWAAAEKEAKAQQDALLEARRLLAAKKTDDAMNALAGIVEGDVRYTEEWSDARKMLRDLEKKAEEEKQAGK